MNTHTSNSYTTIPADVRRRIEDALTEAATSRRSQLGALPDTDRDATAAAHRASVTRILTEVEAAQARLADGTFGHCARCDTAIPSERLELRPWTRLCVGCASR
ncbi:TraR/DksA family transcriptional regulator [Haloactinopolyspora alba]|uniref:TraR/DksA family transcriptional regulator n=1 Tax=Haloactinopolyspora alba TaxID=648780 RepID=A0A2P8EF32_9ACTN|nr:TraR/DksA C4-type zinc finger protein [Haloactinopolyspora alba]PSL08073.1 TraR/DksA family transcriptional regulator [Haloactinopolyspora alba]